jgi:stage III sporulation protein AB
MAASRQLKERIQRTQALIHGLTLLETDIGYGLIPLPEAFARVARSVDGAVAALFLDIAHRLDHAYDEGTASMRYEAAIDAVWPQLALSARERETMRALAPMLGWSDRREQCKHIRLCVTTLGYAEQQARAREEKYGTLYTRIGFLIALLIVIVAY